MIAKEARKTADAAYQKAVVEVGIRQYHTISLAVEKEAANHKYNYSVDMSKCNKHAEELLKLDGYTISYYDDYKTEYCSISW